MANRNYFPMLTEKADCLLFIEVLWPCLLVGLINLGQGGVIQDWFQSLTAIYRHCIYIRYVFLAILLCVLSHQFTERYHIIQYHTIQSHSMIQN